MATINPYLNFPGTTEAAFTLYKAAFGGEFLGINRFKDMPDTDNIPPEALDKIMHIALAIGKGHILMASDAPASMGFTVTAGNNFYIPVNVDSREEADQIFAALSEGEKLKCLWPILSGEHTMDRLKISSTLDG